MLKMEDLIYLRLNLGLSVYIDKEALDIQIGAEMSDPWVIQVGSIDKHGHGGSHDNVLDVLIRDQEIRSESMAHFPQYQPLTLKEEITDLH